MSSGLTGQTVELLQTPIRNQCVNDGTATSGNETRNADVLRQFLGGTGLDSHQTGPSTQGPSRFAPARGRWFAGRPSDLDCGTSCRPWGGIPYRFVTVTGPWASRRAGVTGLGIAGRPSDSEKWASQTH